MGQAGFIRTVPLVLHETGRIPFGQFCVSYREFVVSVGIVRIVLLVCLGHGTL